MSGKLRKKGNGRMRSKFRIAFDIMAELNKLLAEK